MPKVKANGITMNYEQQGAGEPLVLIPFLAADNACYAFQVADYAKHFTCISVDPRGAGETDKPAGAYSMELFADDVAAFMRAIGVQRAHVSGLSLGAATGLWVAAKYPELVKSLSLHSGWTKKRPVPQDRGRRLAEHRQGPRQRHGNGRPGYLSMVLHAGTLCGQAGLHRPACGLRPQPAEAALDAFIQQSNAVIAHDAAAQLGRVKAPTQITFGRHDMVTSTRFADAMKSGIKESELLVFETCAHAPIYQSVAEFNEKTLSFSKTPLGSVVTTPKPAAGARASGRPRRRGKSQPAPR